MLKSLYCRDKHSSSRAAKPDHTVCNLPLPAGLQPWLTLWEGEGQESSTSLKWAKLSSIVKPFIYHVQAQHWSSYLWWSPGLPECGKLDFPPSKAEDAQLPLPESSCFVLYTKFTDPVTNVRFPGLSWQYVVWSPQPASALLSKAWQRLLQSQCSPSLTNQVRRVDS